MRFPMFIILSALASCAGYDVKVNENVVYSPPKLFTDFRLADRALQNCVQQTITDQGITKPGQLTRLACTNGAIRSLEGIELFTGLQQLNLSNNSLQGIDPLAALPALQHLVLASNEIKSVTSLTQITTLLTLNLQDNPTLDCVTVVEEMRQMPALQLKLPTHCQNKVK